MNLQEISVLSEMVGGATQALEIIKNLEIMREHTHVFRDVLDFTHIYPVKDYVSKRKHQALFAIDALKSFIDFDSVHNQMCIYVEPTKRGKQLYNIAINNIYYEEFVSNNRVWNINGQQQTEFISKGLKSSMSNGKLSLDNEASVTTVLKNKEKFIHELHEDDTLSCLNCKHFIPTDNKHPIISKAQPGRCSLARWNYDPNQKLTLHETMACKAYDGPIGELRITYDDKGMGYRNLEVS